MDYSIAVGIDEYKDPNIDKSLYSENDAQEYSQIMGQQFELQTNILLLGNNATKQKIKDEIEKMTVVEDDRVFVFLQGMEKTYMMSRGYVVMIRQGMQWIIRKHG